MAETLTKHTTKRANHAIAVAGVLSLPDVDLPIHPYFLGVWLGDGNSYNNLITTADPDILPLIEQLGYAVRRIESHPYQYAVDDEMAKPSAAGNRA
jgi:replicative DNA helicase